MKRLLILLAACGGAEHVATNPNPSCDDVIEHGYTLASDGMLGDHAIEARREFMRAKPQLIETCEQRGLTLERKRCMMNAGSRGDMEACKTAP